MQERIEFRNSRGQKLAGKMSVPHGKGPFPALVFAHGRGSGKNAKKAVELSKRLGDGFVCFSFDFSGCYESEGKFEDTTITDEINDLKTAIELVRKMPFVKEVHIVGSSLGGLVALLYAAKYNKLKSLVLHCPAFDFRQTYSDKNGKYGLREWRGKGYTVVETSWGEDRIKYDFYKDGLKYDTIKETGKISCPTLLVHGDQDENVPVEQSKRLFDCLKCEKRLEIVNGADHRFSREPDFEKLMVLTIKWLNEHSI